MLILQSNWWLAPIDWFFVHEMGFILGRTHLQFTLRRFAMAEEFIDTNYFLVSFKANDSRIIYSPNGYKLQQIKKLF